MSELYKDNIIEKESIDDEIKTEGTLAYKTLVSPDIRGGNAVIGSGNKVMRFQQDKGLWLGNASFDDAPFRVGVDGAVVATNITLTGYLEDGEAALDINNNATTIDGGKITTNTITATQINVSQLSAISADIGSITAGTITGVTLQTSSDTNAERIVISGNDLKFYDSSGNKRGVTSDGFMAFYDDTESFSASIGGTNTNILTFSFAPVGSGLFMSSSGLFPITSPGQDLGSGTLRWGTVYTTDLNISGDITGDFVPSSDSSYDLGSSTYRWNNIYSDYLNIDSTVTINNAEFQGSLVPDPDDNWSLGNSSNIWEYAYVGGLMYYNQQKLDLTPSAGPQWSNNPMGFYKNSGTPGTASGYEGYMYYDTSKDNLVYSDGAGWFEVQASAY